MDERQYGYLWAVMMPGRIIALLFLLGSLTAFSQNACPPEGNAKTEKKMMQNRLKNRPVVLQEEPKVLSIDSILKQGSDEKRFSSADLVTVEGYVTGVKPGGPESCNCQSKKPEDHDMHMYIGKSPDAEKKDCFVVETTPAYKRLHSTNYSDLVGKKVRVTGYLFYDAEHWSNALNTCLKCKNVWRKTAWEIHPVVKIEEIR